MQDNSPTLNIPSTRMVEGRVIQLISAFAIYLLLSIYFFSIPAIFHLSQIYINIREDADPSIFMWALVWWPYSLLHHLNPFFPRVIFAPSGYNLAWAATMPGPSLLAYPLTRWLGPVASYNVLCLLAPPFAAWAEFLLCRHIVGRFWPALLGGYVFGFSSYVIGQVYNHLFLVMIFPILLMVLLVLLELNQKIGKARFITLFALLLIFEFLASMEVFATTTIVGASAIVLGLLILRPERKVALWHSLAPISFAYFVSLLVLAPYLYFIFMRREPAPINSAMQFSSDLLNFIVPTRITLIGGKYFHSISDRFTSGPSVVEAASYLGGPLLAVLVLFAWSYWSSRSSKMMVLTLIAVCVGSLGPALHVAGWLSSIPLPWILCLHLPLVDQALPARLSMYSFLLAGIMAALYLSDRQHLRIIRVPMGILVVLFLLPNVPFLRLWGKARVDQPAFFRDGFYKTYLDRNDAVLTLSRSNFQMIWQAQTGMYFSIPDGYLGPDPPEFASWPVTVDLRRGKIGLDFKAQLECFLGAHRVKAIIVDARKRDLWLNALSVLKVSPVETAGVFLYRVPRDVLITYKNASPAAFEARYERLLFFAGISGAQRYVAAGLPLSKLTPWEAEHKHLLETPTPAEPLPWDPRWQGDLWLGTYSGNDIGIGVMGTYAEVKPIIDKFSRYTDQVYFPFPNKVANDLATETRGQLLVVFTPSQLDNAARAASSASYRKDPASS